MRPCRAVVAATVLLAWFSLTPAVAIDDSRVARLEEQVRKLTLVVDALLEQGLHQGMSLRGGEEQSTRLSVCVAIPCIPRHLESLRRVLSDIRAQTMAPNEVRESGLETDPS